MTRLVRLLAVSALVLGIVGAPASALADQRHAAALPAFAALPGDASNFSFRSFDAVYALGRDADQHATLGVTETMVAVFPQSDQNHGILRDIPATYGSADLQTDVASVVDQHGRAVPYQQSDQGDYIQLQIGSGSTYVHGATTYVISYTQRDTVRHFSDTGDDEFYWDVNGTGWSQPFGEVSATINVAGELTGALNGHTACYQGALNDTTPCDSGVLPIAGSSPAATPTASATPDTASPTDTATPVATAPSGFTARAQNLEASQTLTVAIGFASGSFVDESGKAPIDNGNTDGGVTDAEANGYLLSLLGFPAVLVGTIGGFVARRKRVQPARGIIVPQYSPPDDLDVMAAAELIGKPSTEVPAQLVSLAVRGKIRLLGYPVGSARAADYSVQLLDRTGLTGFEPLVIEDLFGDKKVGATRDLKKHGDTELASKLQAVLGLVPGWLDDNGAYSGRRHTPGSIVVLVITAALFLAALGGALAGGATGLAFGFVSLMAGGVGVLTAIAGVSGVKRLSDKGAKWNDYLLGMRMYLQLAEEDRLRVLQSPTGAERIDIGDGKVLVKLYEKMLPWAVIWGVEDQWSKVLEIELQRTNTTPDFWVGQSAFNSVIFSSMISGIGTSTLPVPTSTTSGSGSSFSSFSGGSFGGGFSGGGGGGGGGGGW
ncbi:MAG: DUF2207 domain-containing protein [Pseudolysinimonas sp.]